VLAFVERILPLRRCITGEGLRQTLRAIGDRVPLQITEVPTPAVNWSISSCWPRNRL
jgi:aminopeptidase-like protein